jgi:MerR family mercuric resistance operon transcriptional regulator
MKSVSCCVSSTSETSRAPRRAVAATHLDDVQAKIADLKRMERVLKKVVAQCADGTLPECPLIETLFRQTPFQLGS